VIRAISLDEELELLSRLQSGEVATALALPIVDVVPPAR
jgi:hypothetical protein